MLTTLQAKAYPYHQFTDDVNITAFFDAYNKIAQDYLTWLVEHPFALYTRSEITGGFLNYCAYCLYGQFRYRISDVHLQGYTGALNDTDINRLAVDEVDIRKQYKGAAISDDNFKRILTWNFYKGDGLNFTIPWLKKRVMRFLTGENGKTKQFNNCEKISVTFQGRHITITVKPGNWDEKLVSVLDNIINNGVLNIPVMFKFTVTNQQD